MTRPVARLAGVHKRFGGVVALDGAELDLFPGEVHGVLGENGAGKTTLLGVLGGMVRPDAGSVEVRGALKTLRRPRDAWSAGVGMVHQHFTLVPPLTVMENLALGRRSAAGGFSLPFQGLLAEVEELMEETGLRVPLEERVERLGVGARQRVEILKALLRRPDILVLDEPTAVLTPGEVESLFRLLRGLAEEGKAVVLVAHKLDEILGVAHRITVLRRGANVLTALRGQLDAPGLIRAMIGPARADGAALGHLEGEVIRGSAVAGDQAGPQASEAPVASVVDLRVMGGRGEWVVDGATLHVGRGEVVGIAGVEGNGQRELALALAGRLTPDEGEVRIPSSVGFIPQDRAIEGLAQDFDLTANVALALHDDPAFTWGPFLRWDSLRVRTAELLERFQVTAAGPGARARSLSGGNQQRVVVARELSLPRDLVVAENPTRGLDVAAAAFVHDELRRVTGEGKRAGVVLISTDLDEVLALAHRVLVMVRGALVAVPRDQLTRQGVGAYMLSGTRG